MKQRTFLGFLALLLAGTALLSPVESRAFDAPAHPLVESTESEVEFELTGLHCASCNLKIRKSLESVDGVGALREGRTKQHLIVKYDDKKTNPAALIAKIKETGYGAAVVK